MCGRLTLITQAKELETTFQSSVYASEVQKYSQPPFFNACPTQYYPIIAGADPKHIRYFRWGLIPEGSVGAKQPLLIHAKSETVLDKAPFRKNIQSHRCLVPCTGYIEWKVFGKRKIPYLFQAQTPKIWAMAGVWDEWTNEQEEKIYSFAILTKPAEKELEDIHERMPCFIQPEHYAFWLDLKMDAGQALKLILSKNQADIRFFPVSEKLNASFENKDAFLKSTPYTLVDQLKLF